MYEVEILRMTLKGKMYEITLHYKYYFNIADRVTVTYTQYSIF